MNNDVEKKLASLLSGINPAVLKNANLEKLLNSEQGKKIANSLSDKDRQKLMSAFMSMSNEEIKNKLSNTKLSELSGLSAEEILKKLR